MSNNPYLDQYLYISYAVFVVERAELPIPQLMSRNATEWQVFGNNHAIKQNILEFHSFLPYEMAFLLKE